MNKTAPGSMVLPDAKRSDGNEYRPASEGKFGIDQMLFNYVHDMASEAPQAFFRCGRCSTAYRPLHGAFPFDLERL
jgi:hypothetical protein